MKEQIYDEQNGLWYQLVGDYYEPIFDHDEEENNVSLGPWARIRCEYLQRHKRAFYHSLLSAGNLHLHLEETDRQAEELFYRLEKDFALREGVTETLKATDQLEWVRRMNSIQDRVTEIVNHEVIFI